MASKGGHARRITHLYSKLVNMRAIAGGCILIIIAMMLLWVSERFAKADPILLGNVLPALAAVIGTSGVFSIIYETLIRREQTEYVLRALELRESLLRAGLEDTFEDYLSYDFAASITSASRIDLFFLYGHTWIARFREELRAFTTRRKTHLRLVVPHPDNPFIDALAQHFGYTSEGVRNRICRAIEECIAPVAREQLGEKSVVQIFLHSSRPSYTSYRFDDDILFGPYLSGKEFTRSPMFEFSKPGVLYETFSLDLEKVIAESGQLVFCSQSGINSLYQSLGDSMPESLRMILANEASKPERKSS